LGNLGVLAALREAKSRRLRLRIKIKKGSLLCS
jgi:hypothetical protein